MNKIEIKKFILENNPDIILGWYTNLATPEEKLFAATIMRNAIDMAVAETETPLNLMKDKVSSTTGSIMGIS